MKLILGESHKITYYSKGFKIEEKQTVEDEESNNHGEEYWTNPNYFKNLEQTLRYYIDESIKKSEVKEIQEVIQAIEEAKNNIKEMLVNYE